VIPTDADTVPSVPRICAVPRAMPVTVPSADTVAVLGALLLHTVPDVATL
jgi:hypothetical protein